MDQPTPTPPPVPPSLPPAVPTPHIPTQAGVPLPPTAFRVPPSAEPPRKSSSGTGTMITCGLLVLAVMGFVGKTVVKRLAKARGADRAATELQNGTANPYELMSRDYSRNPSKFRTGVAKGAARGLKKNVPQATFTLDDAAAVDDLGKALRTVIGYRGELPGPDGEISLQGQLRQYVHPNGMIMVESACFSTYSMCLELEDLATSTDQTVLANLNGNSVRSLLPPDGECEPTSLVQGRELMVCRFGDEIVVTYQKLTLEQTRREFQRIATDPAFKDQEGQ